MTALARDAFGLRTKVEVSFDSGPSDDPSTATWTDVTADTLQVSVDRGRGSESEQMSVGRASVTLRDPDGRYDATTNDLNEFPNDGFKVPGRRVRMRVSDVGGLLEAWRADRLFSLGELSGTVAYDEGATGGLTVPVRTNGTYVGGVTLGATGAHALETTAAATFDGTTGYVDTNGDVSPGTWSLVVWINEDGTDGRHVCGADEVFYVRTTASRKVEVGVYVDGDWQVCTSTGTLTAGWHQIVVGYGHSGSAGELRVYVDGTFDTGVETVGPIDTSHADRLEVGRASATSTLWAGELQHFAWWSDYQLTPVQIARLHTMSTTGVFLFSGFVASWTQSRDDAPVGVSETTLACLDGGDLLNQFRVEPDGRSQVLRLNPTQFFSFDNEALADAQGGDPAQFAVGSRIEALFDSLFGFPIFVGFRRNTFTPSVTTGVSQGAVSLTSIQNSPVSGVPTFELARVTLPPPSSGSTVPSAFMAWVRADGAERYEPDSNLDEVGGILPMLWTSEKIGSIWRHWYFGLGYNGRYMMRVADRGGPQPWSTLDAGLVVWEGKQSITNGRWHHIAIVRDTSQGTYSGIQMDSHLYINGEREQNFLSQVAPGDLNIALPSVPWKAVLGGITKTYEVDELALWYGSVQPTPDDIKFVYELTATGYQGDTVRERADRMLDWAGWTDGRDLSASAGTVMSNVGSGQAWGLLQQAASAEMGTFEIAADGTARLRSRQDRRRLGPTPSVDDGGVGGYSNIEVTTDDRYLFTAAQVDGSYYEDTSKIADYGRRVFTMNADLLPNDAAGRARGIVDRYSTFAPRTDQLSFELPGMFGIVGLVADVGDVMTISRQPFRTTTSWSQDVHVERVSVSLDGETKRGRVQLQVSPADPVQNTYFTVGVSTLDSADILGW